MKKKLASTRVLATTGTCCGRRILSILLCLVLTLTLLPTAAFAEGEATTQAGKAVLGGFRAGGTAGSAYITNNSANSLKILAHKTNASYGEYTPDKRFGDVAILGSYNPKNAMASSNPGYAYDEDDETAIVVVETGRRMTRTDKFQSGMTYRFTFCETGHTLFGAPFADYLGELTKDNFTFRTAPGEGSPTIEKVEAVPQKHGSETQGFYYNVEIKIPGSKERHSVNVSAPVTTSKNTATEGTEVTVTAPKLNEGKVFVDWAITANGKRYTNTSDFKRYCGLTNFSSDKGGSDNVTCMFKMGDRDITVEALYSAEGIIEFNTVKLNILPPFSGGRAEVAVQPVFGNEGEAYSVGYAFLGKDDKNKTEPGFYTGIKSGEKFDKSQYRYLLTVWLYVNVDHYKFTDNANAVKFVINGTEYPGEKGKVLAREDDRCPVSYEHLIGVNSVSGKYETLKVYIPVGTPNNLQPYYNDGITAIPALDFAEPLTATLTVDGKTAADNQFTVEQGSHTAALNVTVPKSVCARIDDGTVSLVPAILGLYQDSLAGENLWESNPDRVSPHSDGSCTYTYSTSFSNAEAGHTYFPIGAVNLVSTGQEVQYLTSAAASGSVKVTPAKVISGSIVYTESCRFDRKLTTGVTVKVGGAVISEEHYTYQWQRKDVSGSEADWDDIAGATEKQYTPVAADVGKEIRLVINGTNGYTGMIVGDAKTVEKAVWTDYPAVPGVEWTDGKVNVLGTTENQEYIVAYKAEGPTAGTWTQGNGRTLTLDATAGTTVYVYTRMCADETHLAGEKYSYNYLYTGITTSLNAITLDQKTVNLAQNGVQAVTVNPIPETASDWETRTINWYVNGETNVANMVKLYKDSSCTTELEKEGNIYKAISNKTVYIKGLQQTTHAIVGARVTLGYNDVRVATCTVNVADESGIFYPDNVNFNHNIDPVAAPSNAITMDYTVEPAEAKLSASGWKLKRIKAGGTTEEVAMADGELTVNDEKHTVTINIPANREEGSYRYEPSTSGTSTPYILVKVSKSAIPLDGLTMQSKLTMDKDSNFTLTAVKNPVNAAGTITYTSSKTDVATVDATGKITAVNTGTTIITAACSGKTAVCEVTVIDPTHTHKVSSWSKFSETQHIGSCTTCGAVQYANHSWSLSDTSSDTAYDYRYCICTDCGAAKTEATAKSSSGGSSSGDSGSGSVSSSYVITVKDAKNGDVTADRKSASAGTTVTITVKPDSGYVLDDLTVTDAKDKAIKLTDKGSGKYTFTMPSSKVTVEASFSKAKDGNPFVDVKPGAYYEDAVIWAVGKGITGGTSATTFDPNATCNRAQAVTFLWRAAGSPAPKSTTMPFTDVPAGSYYYDAVLWAVENDVTNGTSATTFGPNESCNRAQIVTFLWRARKSPAAAAANPFTDVAADAYYTNAVLWAVKEGVTAGTTATTFSPAADCTRAQIVTFIYRALAD